MFEVPVFEMSEGDLFEGARLVDLSGEFSAGGGTDVLSPPRWDSPEWEVRFLFRLSDGNMRRGRWCEDGLLLDECELSDWALVACSHVVQLGLDLLERCLPPSPGYQDTPPGLSVFVKCDASAMNLEQGAHLPAGSIRDEFGVVF